jgi:hypothetical protein
LHKGTNTQRRRNADKRVRAKRSTRKGETRCGEAKLRFPQIATTGGREAPDLTGRRMPRDLVSVRVINGNAGRLASCSPRKRKLQMCGANPRKTGAGRARAGVWEPGRR